MNITLATSKLAYDKEATKDEQRIQSDDARQIAAECFSSPHLVTSVWRINNITVTGKILRWGCK
jgi:hypothetical protein